MARRRNWIRDLEARAKKADILGVRGAEVLTLIEEVQALEIERAHLKKLVQELLPLVPPERLSTATRRALNLDS